MKITKRQLRRIIREEKARLIKEEHFEGWNPSELMDDALEPIVDEFMEYSKKQLKMARKALLAQPFDLTQALLAAIEEELEDRD